MVVKLVVLGEDKNRLPILDYQEAVIIMALSDAALKNAKPRDKKYTISDTGGLSIEVKPNGNKLWRFRYTYNGERKWMSFGPYPEVSLKMAREKRDKARVLLADNKDPLEEKNGSKNRANLPTFRNVANEWYDLKKSSWAPSNQKTMRQRIDVHLLNKDFADKPMEVLKATDFIKVLRNIKASGHYEMAHRVSNICDRICTFAKLSGIIDQNPVTG